MEYFSLRAWLQHAFAPFDATGPLVQSNKKNWQCWNCQGSMPERFQGMAGVHLMMGGSKSTLTEALQWKRGEVELEAWLDLPRP